jgi:hypothetical protein
MMLLVLIATQAVAATDTIAGTVTGPGGRPLAGAIVQATSSVTRLSRWQTSDAGGRFSIQFPGRAPYEVTAHYFGLVRERGVEPLWTRQDRRAASIRLELAGIENPIGTILSAYGVLGLSGDQISRLRDVAASSDSVTLSVLERARTVLTPSQWTRVSTERLPAAAVRPQTGSASPTMYAVAGTVAPPESHAALPDEPAREVAHSSDSTGRLALRVGSVAQGIVLDGVLSDPDWKNAESITDLVTIEPVEEGTPAGRTEVKVLASSTDLIIGIASYDTNAAGIVAYSVARDAELAEEDHVVLVFDTFQDGRSGYVFSINPLGARFDGLVIEAGEEVNADWDAIWEAKTSRDAAGWYAEVRIPIKSLSFGKGLDSWGFNIQRRVQRLQETSRWSGADIDLEVYQTSQAGLLTNLPRFDLGVGMSVRPAVVGSAGRPDPLASTEFDGDVSLDITQKIGPNVLSALTVNTDFAETEVDVRQVNLTRFPLFFPEKRSFFLEGSDIFEFGLGLDEDNMIPFFSRRIGLPGLEGDQTEIPINVGGKVNGRVGNTNIGALVVNTRQVDSLDLGDDEFIDVPATTMGAVRIRQNVLEESSFGVLAEFGDQLGRRDSWAAGADFTFQTSNLGDEKRLLIGVWGMMNDREDLTGDKSALGFRIDYPNDLIEFTFNSIRIGDGFDPSLSFVPRNGIHLWSGGIQWNPRPAWGLVRQMFHEVGLSVYANQENTAWESYNGEVKPFDWQLESGDRLTAELLPQGDRPPEAFEISDGVIIPSGEYRWTRYALTARGAEKRRVSGEVRFENGTFYNGDLSTIEARLTLRPMPLVHLVLTAERNKGTLTAIEDSVTLAEMDVLEQVFGARVLLNFSSDLEFSSLSQYDTESKEFGSNNRLRWTFSPYGDLFLVYNHNMIRTDDPRWAFESNQAPVKIQYTWRF